MDPCTWCRDDKNPSCPLCLPRWDVDHKLDQCRHTHKDKGLDKERDRTHTRAMRWGDADPHKERHKKKREGERR